MLLPGGSNKLSGDSLAVLVVIGLALALETGVTTLAPFSVTLLIAFLVASFTSLNLSINCKKDIFWDSSINKELKIYGIPISNPFLYKLIT